jgi:putative oxidoreductase
MDWTQPTLLAGRLLFGGYFLISGLGHFRARKAMAGYASSKGVPAPTLAVLGTGVLLALGGLSVLTGLYPVLGLAMLAIFLVGVTPQMHNFWAIADPMQRMSEQVNFLKNAALLGGVLALMALPQPWSFSL